MNNYNEEMVEYAVKLVYSIAHKLRMKQGYLEREFYEEYVSIGLVGVTKALQNYEDSKGTFGTFASKCIINEIFMQNRRRKLNIISLDEKINEDEDIRSRVDMTYSTIDDVESKVIYASILNLIDENKNKIFNKRELEVYNVIRYNPELKQREISDIIDIGTRSNVSRILKRMRAKMYKFIEKHGYYDIF